MLTDETELTTTAIGFGVVPKIVRATDLRRDVGMRDTSALCALSLLWNTWPNKPLA